MCCVRKCLLLLVWLGSIIVYSGCTSKYLKVDNEEQLKNIDEFDATVKITADQEAKAEPKFEEKKTDAKSDSVTSAIKKTTEKKEESSKVKAKVKGKTQKEKEVKEKIKDLENLKRQPDIEDAEGFVGRRPIKDPFRVGEAITHKVHYFKVEAGQLTFSIDPHVQVNGRKSYSLVTHIQSSSLFSKFYSVDDRIVALLDFELLIPRVFTLHLKETGQLKEARSYFDFDQLQAKYWEKKVTEKSGIEEKKLQWEILPYSQNVFSAIFYMRTFAWKPDKDYAFRVADDGENLTFKGRAIRRETLETEVGTFNAIVIKPEIMTKGAFKPVGDIYIWLSDDERKYVLRIESKIKIGTLTSEVTEIKPGAP